MRSVLLLTLVCIPALAHAQNPTYTIEGWPNSIFGAAVTSLGDVNGDGVADIAVGAPNAAGNIGEVRAYSGKQGNLLWTRQGNAANGRFGSALAGNNLLLVVGAPGPEYTDCSCSNPNCIYGPGYVQALNPSTGSVLYTVSTPAGSGLGTSLAIVGDVVGSDGVPEFIAGLPFANKELIGPYGGCGGTLGAAALYNGSNGAKIGQNEGKAHGYGCKFGWSVAGLGDVTGDGVPDYGAATLFSGTNGTVTVQPYIRIYSGALSFPTQPYYEGTIANGGRAIGPVGDIDGDGHPDYGVGSNGAKEVAIYSGYTKSLIRIISASVSYIGFGYKFCSLGDINSDGIPDLAVGAPSQSSNTSYVSVRSGATGAELGYVAQPGNNSFGQSIACLNDITGDSKNDFVVGMPTSAFAPIYGKVFVYASPGGSNNLPLSESFYQINGKTVVF